MEAVIPFNYEWSPFPKSMQNWHLGIQVVHSECYDQTMFSTESKSSQRTYNLPEINGVFPMTMIRVMQRCQVLAENIPPPTYTSIRASSVEERATMFAVASNLTRDTSAPIAAGPMSLALLYCTQLARNKVSRSVKETVTSSSFAWEKHLDKVFQFLGATNMDVVPSAEEMRKKFPIDMITLLARMSIGKSISARDIYLPMQVGAKGLEFPFGRKEEKLDDVHVPVIIVEPLRILSPHPEITEMQGVRNEFQLFVIAGDVLIVAYHSDIMSISCAHNIAFERAGLHGVAYVRAIITWDIFSGQLYMNKYN